MQFSLMQITNTSPSGLIDGVWLQDCVATTLENAIKTAKATEKANSNRIKVAVVKKVEGTNLIGAMRYELKDLRK